MVGVELHKVRIMKNQLFKLTSLQGYTVVYFENLRKSLNSSFKSRNTKKIQFQA